LHSSDEQPRQARRLLSTGDPETVVTAPVLAFDEGLSFWGGVDPDTGAIIDAHHPQRGAVVSGQIVLMPTSRGSCSGSGVLLALALGGKAPAALVFREPEETLSLGALVANRLFDRPVPVLFLPPPDYAALSRTEHARLDAAGLAFELDGQARTVAVEGLGAEAVQLSEADRARLSGGQGRAVQVAMEVIAQMAAAQGAFELLDVSRGHIDGCILAHDANLIFAETMADMGAQVGIPTTINAISVDREAWQDQGVPNDFGQRASRLAEAYVRMGAQPTFTCAPYHREDRPVQGEAIGWSESNAVIYANSVLGARTTKHPDYLDLFIAMTGRAPRAGVYEDAGRRPARVLQFDVPTWPVADDSLWPLVGWLAGKAAPDCVPLITGFEQATLSEDDLRAICAAFGTTSGAPMLHVAGHTPEADLTPLDGARHANLSLADLRDAWRALNRASGAVDLVAIGSPHASFAECQRVAGLLNGRSCDAAPMIITLARDVLAELKAEGNAAVLEAAGVTLVADLCWCSITEPVFPPAARSILTNSGKYAHYAHGLSGREVRLGGLEACVEAAVLGLTPSRPPDWLGSAA
jgi:predicted aconitase/predicted aconitase with swiveling domain